MKRALIFDFGGVLMQTRSHAPRLAWDQRLGLPPGTVETIVHSSESWRQAQCGLITPDAYWQHVAEQLQLDVNSLAQLKADYFSADTLEMPLIDSIRQWRASGHRIALLSNDSPALHDRLRVLGIDTLFAPLVISGRIGVMKPDPAAYQAVLARLNLPAEQTIFIDDVPVNVEAATALGIHGVHYRAGLDLSAALLPLLNS